MRVGYKTRMRFYSDTPDSTEIVWYPVDERTPFLPFPTVFFSWEWIEDNPPGNRVPGGVGLGEQIEADRIRPTRFIPAWSGFTGKICGTPEQWVKGDGLPVVPPPLQASGFPRCCGRNAIPFPDIYDCDILAILANCLYAQYTDYTSAQTILKDAFGDVFTWTYQEDNGPALMPGMFIGVNADWTIVVVSGSTHPQQFLQQALNGLNMRNNVTGEGFAFGSSDLYYRFGLTVHNRVLAALPLGGRVLVVGHSYGGAICNVAAALLATSSFGYETYLVTMGAPRAGDFRLKNLIRDQVEAVVQISNDGDPTPRFPIYVPPNMVALFPNIPLGVWNSYADNHGLYGLATNGVLYGNPTPGLSPGTIVYILSRVLTNRAVEAFVAHSPREYRRRLNLENCRGVMVVLPDPILWLRPEELVALNVGDHLPSWQDVSHLANAVTATGPTYPLVGDGVDGWNAAHLPAPAGAPLNQLAIAGGLAFGPQYTVFVVGKWGFLLPHVGTNQYGPAMLDGFDIRNSQFGVSSHAGLTFATAPPGGISDGAWWFRHDANKVDAFTSWGQSFTAPDPGYTGGTAAQIRPSFQAPNHPDATLQEVIVYNVALTDDQIAEQVTRLSEKYPSMFTDPPS